MLVTQLLRTPAVVTGTMAMLSSESDLEKYLSKLNPSYVKYAEGLWANEITSTSQLGNASAKSMLACGVQKSILDIIARSKPTGKCFCDLNGGDL
ncbi:TPA: hypothetical protein ACH3X1_003645 [Trebouxia sp. C0004]